MRLVSRAICTSGDPVSLSWRRCSAMTPGFCVDDLGHGLPGMDGAARAARWVSDPAPWTRSLGVASERSPERPSTPDQTSPG